MLTNERAVFAVPCEPWVTLTGVSEGVDVEDTGGIGMATVTLVLVSLTHQTVPAEPLPTLTLVALLLVVIDTLGILVTNLGGLVTLKG